MELEFLGGASKVGSLGMIVKINGTKMLIDYGITPTDPPGYPVRTTAMDAVLLTHAHVDHSGMIPWYAGKYESPIHASPPTIDVGLMLMEDTIKVTQAEGYPLPYEHGDVRAAQRNFNETEIGETFHVGDTEIETFSAGHIPGAMMYMVKSHESLLFTGDINTIDTRLVNRCDMPQCDTLVLESTYAGRTHPDRMRTEMAFQRKVDEVVARGGVAVVPAFAVGRTQEAAMVLSQSRHRIWLDGMGKRVNEAFLDHPNYLASAKKLRKAINVCEAVRNTGARKQALQGDVIITTSGMLDGGPALSYIDKLRHDPKNAILLTGYQVEGTNGRRLMDTGTMVFNGEEKEINCEVAFFDFSAHADHKQLLRFVDKCEPTKVVLMHGDQREVLAKDLEGYRVVMPKEGDKIEV